MSKLSVAIATFNEEENIGNCLESVKNLADEIIVVDGGSTDETVKIAKKNNAKILITDNPAIFHINKQKAIDMATCDWIFQLDADEIVSGNLEKDVRQILTVDDKDINGYWIPRKNWFLGRFLIKGGQYPDYTLRLYRKGKASLPQKSVHEQAIVEGKTAYLKSALLHYPYRDFKHYIKKWEQYNNLFAEEINDDLKNKKNIFKLIYIFVILFVKPVYWFLSTYIRHKGFMDSWQGFVFSFFSALRFPVAYFKSIEK